MAGTLKLHGAMKRFLPLFFTLCFCALAHAQFRERPATTKRRASQKAARVEGNLWKMLDFAVSGRVIALSFSPKGDFLAVATSTTLALVSETGTRKLLIWDATKEAPAPFEDRPLTKAVLAFSPDGKQLFFCGPQGLSVWNWPDGLSLDQAPVRAWNAPDVYNLVLADENQLVCAAKKGSPHFVQVRKTLDGTIALEKESGLLPITSMRIAGSSVRCVVGNATGSQCYWSDWNLADGSHSLPIDLGQLSAFSASQSPDGKTGAVVNWDLSIINLETGEAKVPLAPVHSSYYGYWHGYDLDWPFAKRYRLDDDRVDAGWTTLFSPDGNLVVSIGKEAVFYDKSTGIIVGRIFYSDDPFPDIYTTQAEADGVGCFSPDGERFALVRQSRVSYEVVYSESRQKHVVQRQAQGDSGVEIYAVGG